MTTVSDAVYDAALEDLAAGGIDHHLDPFVVCSGCDLRVHHSDLTDHAKSCTLLHALMIREVSNAE